MKFSGILWSINYACIYISILDEWRTEDDWKKELTFWCDYTDEKYGRKPLESLPLTILHGQIEWENFVGH